MNEKEFMKHVSAYAMPNIASVKELCLAQLNEDKENETKTAWFAGVIVAAVLMVCLCVSPVNTLAKNMLSYIRTMINLNGSSVELGDTDKFSITIPEDCEAVEVEGVTYLSKAYDTVSALTDDIGINIYTWQGGSPQTGDVVLLSIVENDYGRIAVIYDTDGMKMPDEEESVDVIPVTMFAYFPLSEENSLGELEGNPLGGLLLQNEQRVYSNFDDGDGTVEEYLENTEYELVEQYESDILDTTITVIASQTDSKGTGDLGELDDMDTLYYLYFTKDGICYQINVLGTLDGAHKAIEKMALQ